MSSGRPALEAMQPSTTAGIASSRFKARGSQNCCNGGGTGKGRRRTMVADHPGESTSTGERGVVLGGSDDVSRDSSGGASHFQWWPHDDKGK